jgi:Tfp pilus assembly protein PilO
MKNITSLILIILAIGLFFMYTNGEIQGMKSIQVSNATYATAIQNSQQLIAERDKVLAVYNTLTDQEKANLNKILPDNVDNVRLMIDMNNIASRHGIILQGLSTSADGSSGNSGGSGSGPATNSGTNPSSDTVNSVSISFGFSSSYANFLSFMKDVESSLRILDISSMSVTANPTGTYNYSMQLQTYWLSQ